MTTLDGIDLSGLVWTDEFDWSGVVTEAAPAINGNLIVQQAALSGGRPVTLQGDAEQGWLLRSALLSLQSKAAVADASYTLAYNGANYTVRFRHEDGQVIAATPIVGRENAAAGDYYHNITLKLITL
jgi:hypothetical protein